MKVVFMKVKRFARSYFAGVYSHILEVTVHPCGKDVVEDLHYLIQKNNSRSVPSPRVITRTPVYKAILEFNFPLMSIIQYFEDLDYKVLIDTDLKAFSKYYYKKSKRKEETW